MQRKSRCSLQNLEREGNIIEKTYRVIKGSPESQLEPEQLERKRKLQNHGFME